MNETVLARHFAMNKFQDWHHEDPPIDCRILSFEPRGEVVVQYENGRWFDDKGHAHPKPKFWKYLRRDWELLNRSKEAVNNNAVTGR
jgi:hypothetical protein